MQPNNVSELLPPGQTVLARINKVDTEKCRFLATLRKQECYEGGVESSLNYLHTLLRARLDILENMLPGHGMIFTNAW